MMELADAVVLVTKTPLTSISPYVALCKKVHQRNMLVVMTRFDDILKKAKSNMGESLKTDSPQDFLKKTKEIRRRHSASLLDFNIDRNHFFISGLIIHEGSTSWNKEDQTFFQGYAEYILAQRTELRLKIADLIGAKVHKK